LSQHSRQWFNCFCDGSDDAAERIARVSFPITESTPTRRDAVMPDARLWIIAIDLCERAGFELPNDMHGQSIPIKPSVVTNFKNNLFAEHAHFKFRGDIMF